MRLIPTSSTQRNRAQDGKLSSLECCHQGQTGGGRGDTLTSSYDWLPLSSPGLNHIHSQAASAVTGRQEFSNDTQQQACGSTPSQMHVNIYELPPWGKNVACPSTFQEVPWPSACPCPGQPHSPCLSLDPRALSSKGSAKFQVSLSQGQSNCRALQRAQDGLEG